MGEEKLAAPSAVAAAMCARGSGDREMLIPVGGDVEDPAKSSPSSPNAYQSSRKAFYAVLQSWVSKKFMSGCVVLFPVAITFYITWWFIQFVDGFFRPIYVRLGINIFGLGFITSLFFIFLMGLFVSSWMGASVLWVGEWFIKKMPLVKHIYSASKQISAAISPDQNTRAFKEVAIIRHPRVGEYAFGFITSSLVLQITIIIINFNKAACLLVESGDEELCSVYVPTNHLYIEIVVSVGMSMPQLISVLERTSETVDRTRMNRG